MKHLFILTALSMASLLGVAQQKGNSEWHVNWEFGVPVGNNFVNSWSALGANIGYAKFIKDHVAVGMEIGWNNYYEYLSRRTFVFEGGAATTDLYKYLYTLPITLNAAYYWEGTKLLTPFVRLGLGAQYSEQNLYYNVYETSNTNWGFVAMPIAGVLIHFDPHSPWSLNFDARYKYATNSAKSLGINSVQTFDFSLGVSCMVK